MGLTQVGAGLVVIVEATTNIGLGYLNCFERGVRREQKSHELISHIDWKYSVFSSKCGARGFKFLHSTAAITHRIDQTLDARVATLV